MSRGWRKQLTPRVVPDDPNTKFASFAGVVNTRSAKDIGMQDLSLGDNVLVTDTKKLVRRDGFTPYIEGSVRSAFGCGSNLYVVIGADIYRSVSASDNHLLVSGLTGTSYSWDDINGEAYFVNGVEAGILAGDTFRPWRLASPSVPVVNVVSTGSAPVAVANVGGTYAAATFRICATYLTTDGRETAPSDFTEVVTTPYANLFTVAVPAAYARTNIYCTEPDGSVFRLVASTTNTVATFNPQVAGRELTTFGRFPLPEGVTDICFVKGVCFAAQYLPSLKQTVIWQSDPLAFHLFDVAEGFQSVSGEVGVLLWNNKGLLIGTTVAIYQYHYDGQLEQLADYGVAPGSGGDTTAEGMAYFWTERGICKAYPFEPVTEANVSMPPGKIANATILYANGMQHFIAVTQGGGEPFNKRRS